MRKWIGIATGLALACAATGQVLAAQPSEKQVRELFEVMHMSQTFSRMNAQMIEVMGKAVPCVPASYWQGFIDANGSQQLLNRMVPIYQSHFTDDDIAGLLTFYRSPLGQKVLTQMPLTMAEGMKVSQQWGRERGQAMIGELQSRGTLDAEGRCPASPGAAAPQPAPASGG